MRQRVAPGGESGPDSRFWGSPDPLLHRERSGHSLVRFRVFCVVAMVVLVGGCLSPAVSATAQSPSAHVDISPGTGALNIGSTFASGTNTTATTVTDARILEAYPNPTANGDPGEYVVVEIPAPGNWTVGDGSTTIPIPNETGTFAISSDPERAQSLTEYPMVGLSDRLRLADRGETLVLEKDGTTVDTITYDRAPASSRWLRDDGELYRSADADGGWRADGFVPREPKTFENTDGRVFVLPDSPSEPIAPIRVAENRVLLAAYTFESWRLADALVTATARGASVRVLVEGSPVGGVTKRQKVVLGYLHRQGVEIRVLHGPESRYSFHHAKYAVADETVITLSENWKPSGTGGAANRGWGVRLDDTEAATAVAAVFDHDATWRDAKTWPQYRETVRFRDGGTANGSYPSRFPPTTFENATVRLLLAPDNAETAIESLIDDADDRVAVVVPRTGGTDYRLVESALAAAERGLTVRLLLSGAWYDREANAALVAELENMNTGRGDLDVRILEPRGRFGKLHAKGAVIDDTAVVGSLNWNTHSGTRNRELVWAIDEPSVANFYWRVCAADWNGGSWRTPVGLFAGVGGFAAVGGAIARREVSFV